MYGSLATSLPWSTLPGLAGFKKETVAIGAESRAKEKSATETTDKLLCIHFLFSDEVDPALLTFSRHLKGVRPAGETVVFASVVIPVLLAIDLVPCCKLDYRGQLKEERRHREKESENIDLILPVFLRDATMPMSTHFMQALPLVEGVSHRYALLESNIANLYGAIEPQI